MNTLMKMSVAVLVAGALTLTTTTEAKAQFVRVIDPYYGVGGIPIVNTAPGAVIVRRPFVRHIIPWSRPRAIAWSIPTSIP
jgi:hypothetical protein